MPHTPEPWEAVQVDKWTWAVRGLDYSLIAIIRADIGKESRLKPDAHLIAAAPDLLAACKRVFGEVGSGGPSSDYVSASTMIEVEAAIAAAENTVKG